MKWLRRIAATLAVMLLVITAATWWLLGTGAGLRFALARAQAATHGALQWRQAKGSLLAPQLRGLHYDDGRGTLIQVDHLRLDLRFWPLFARRVHVLALDVGHVRVALPKAGEDTGSSSTFSLRPPIDVVIDRAHVGAVAITVAGQPAFASDQLDLAGRWTAAGIALDTLKLRAPDGRVDLAGRLAFGPRERGHGTASFTWRAGDTTWAGALRADADGRQAKLAVTLGQPFTATANLAIAQDRKQAWQARLEAPVFDPAPLLGEGTLRRASLALGARGDRRGGTLEGAVTANGYQVNLAPLAITYDARRDTLRVTRLTLHSPQIKGQLDASGTLALGAAPWQAQATVRWNGVELPADLVGQVLASSGSLTASGTPERYRASAALSLGPPHQPVQLDAELDGTPQALTLHRLDARQGNNRLDAHGRLGLAPAIGWQLAASARGFDPGMWFAGWHGALDLQLASTGRHTAQGMDATLDLTQLAGRLRQRAISGNAKLHLDAAHVLDGHLQLRAGRSTITLDAAPGATNNAQLRLAVVTLGDWLPDASGRLDGQFRVQGTWPALAVNGQLHGGQLAWQDQRATRLRLIVGVPDTTRPAGKIDLQGSALRVGGLDFSALHVLAEGSERNHRLDVDARGEPLAVHLALRGAQRGNDWAGTLGALDVDAFGLPRWRLQRASRLAWRGGAFTLAETCLTAGSPLLCVGGRVERNGRLQADYRLQALPAALILDAAGVASDWRVDGALGGNGQVRRDAHGAWSGRAELASLRGEVAWLAPDEPPSLGWSNLAVRAQASATAQELSVRADLDHGGTLAARVALRGRTQALSGNLDLQLPDIGPFAQIGGALANAHGAAHARLALHGTLAQPGLSGNAAISGFSAEVPAAGITLTHGALTATTLDGNRLQLAGQAQSGDGTLHADGTFGLADGSLQLAVRGRQFRAADVPGASVVLSPDLLLTRADDGLSLRGSVALDRADVDLDRLPGGGSASTSSDVVVVDRPQPPPAGALPIRATVKVDLGKRTRLVGFGLDGRLHGELTVNEEPGRAATGQGQITVDGSYKAYGQALHIAGGRLLFAGTPLDNPGLALRAVRNINPNATVDEGQQVGLDIAGTAQHPVLTVFSKPPMEQSDALSYLVTGKPLSQVKGGEGDMLGSAAQALGSAAGNLLAKRIGSELGVDDIGVSSSDALGGGSAFTVGKFLSPRLYLSYGVGLFEPGEVVTLRYRISHRWHIEAQSATDFNRASLNYRREK